jgi:hypothetical protein
MKRIAVELLVVLALALVAAGLWWRTGRGAERRLAGQQTTAAQQRAALESAANRWAEALVASEAEAAFRAFASGIQPLVLANQRQALDQAVGALLALGAVEFVHVVAPDGAILATSDRKLATTGRIPAEGRWVLETASLAVRRGQHPGGLELAAPVVGAAGPAGFLWLGYDTGRVMSEERPPDWPGETVPVPEAARGAPAAV